MVDVSLLERTCKGSCSNLILLLVISEVITEGALTFPPFRTYLNLSAVPPYTSYTKKVAETGRDFLPVLEYACTETVYFPSGTLVNSIKVSAVVCSSNIPGILQETEYPDTVSAYSPAG